MKVYNLGHKRRVDTSTPVFEKKFAEYGIEVDETTSLYISGNPTINAITNCPTSKGTY